LDLDVDDHEIQRVLNACSLSSLVDKIHEVVDWNAILSLGEQQRLNFARLLIAKPNWVILDEPTSAMDKPLEKKIFNVLFQELPNITVLTIGHSVSLKEVHTRCIDL
jgi:putative ATP-binding cassette transporter